MGQDWDQGAVRRVIAVIAGLYVICAVLRLARFNVENSPDPAFHKRFKGLPSPAAAGCVASLALLRAEVSVSWLGLQEPTVQAIVKFAAPLGALLVALLMVSNLPYPHIDRLMRGKRNFGFLIQIVLILCIIVLVRELAMLIIFWAYALNAPLRYVLVDLPRHEPNASVS
jgi:CDP-diacylglycerol--serine O-phosphatidyltransferase